MYMKTSLFFPSITKELYAKTGGQSHGQLIVTGEEINDGTSNKTYMMQFQANKVDKVSGMIFSGDPNAFLEITRSSETNNKIVIYRSPCYETRNPIFKGVEFNLRKFTNGDEHRSVNLNVIHQYSNGDTKILHKFSTTPNELENNPKLVKTDGKMSLTVQTKCILKPSFVQYLHSGLQLNFHVAVDFTGSNGDPRNPQSLHYINPNGQMNSYECGISFIGSVLQQYDFDKMFPAYGFGAKILSTGQITHDFCLSFDPAAPELAGIDGVMTAYKRSIQSVQLWGPTNFSPIINRVGASIRQMEQSGNKNVYTRVSHRAIEGSGKALIVFKRCLMVLVSYI